MKLIFCKYCGDCVKLLSRNRSRCECGKCWGYYKEDGLHAVINREAIPIGFSNPSLIQAIKNRPDFGDGEPFSAFVIPKECATIEVRPSPVKEVE